MAKRPSRALQVLARNLGRLMVASRVYDTQGKVAAKAKVDQKTISRILLLQNEPSIDKLERIAAVFGCEAWQLLVPTFDPLNPPVLAEEVTA